MTNLSFFQLYYDNSTKNLLPSSPISSPVGFTHVYTPNDFKISNDDAMQQFSDGFLRLFEQVRNNPKSEFLAQFERPSQFLALSVFS